MDCKDLLRLDQATYEQIVRELRAASVLSSGTSRRRSERLEFLIPAPMLTVFHHESPAEMEAYQVRPFDLSSHGLGILHGRFVYKGTPTLTLVRNRTGQFQRIAGAVAHCRLIRGRIHAVGIEFSETIDVEQFLDLKSGDALTAESAQALEGWTDLVRVSAREVSKIIRDIEHRAARSESAKRRVEPRTDYRGGAILAIFHPKTEQQARFRVMPTDLSPSGVGFLHGVFVHPGTICHVLLADVQGKPELVTGVVVHCELASGRVHKVGVRFDQSIDLSRFIAGDDPAQAA